MKTILLALILTLTSCEWLVEEILIKDAPKSDPRLVDFLDERVNTVLEENGIRPVRIGISFADISASGRYVYGPLLENHILINWDKENELSGHFTYLLEKTMFHEVGHHFGLDHNNKQNDNGDEVSFMCTKCYVGSRDYYANKDLLIKKLVSDIKRKQGVIVPSECNEGNAEVFN